MMTDLSPRGKSIRPSIQEGLNSLPPTARVGPASPLHRARSLSLLDRDSLTSIQFLNDVHQHVGGEAGGVGDGRGTIGSGFVHIEDGSFESISTSAILRYCKTRVLVPYFRLLAFLGWRPLISQYTLFHNNLCVRIINLLYTLMLMTLIVTGYVLQHSSCYRQDGYRPYIEIDDIVNTSTAPKIYFKNFPPKPTTIEPVNDPSYSLNSIGDGSDDDHEVFLPDASEYETNLKKLTIPHKSLRLEKNKMRPKRSILDEMVVNLRHSSASSTSAPSTQAPDGSNLVPGKVHHAKCRGNLFALYFIPNFLHLMAYVSCLWLMRNPESERLENLMERGFLQTTRTTGWILAHKKLVTSLRSILWMCLFWFVLSIIVHGLIIGPRLQSDDFNLTWMKYEGSIKTFITVLSVISFAFNDFICGAIVTTYAVHAQLNISYIGNLCASIREKRIDFSEFFKRIEESRKFIDYLNQDQATGLNLLIITIGGKVACGLYACLVSDELQYWDWVDILSVSLAMIFWGSLFVVPIVQAVRLTSVCVELRTIGHELRARPYGYQDTSQQDLDSLLLFTTHLKMEGKILRIPVRSSSLLIVSVIILIVILMFGQLGLLNV